MAGLTPDPGSIKPRIVPDEGSVKPRATLAPDPGSVKPRTATPSGGVVEPHGRAGIYSHDQLKKLWTDAGGDPKYADIMAHVALAESGGYIDSNQSHKTNYSEGGKTYFPEGLWQISTIHGKNNMFDPMTNAREAVELFKSNGFEPWEASRVQSGGGGWGQYVGQHFDPHDNKLAKAPPPKQLPPGGMPSVLHSTVPRPVTQQVYESFLSDVADHFEDVIKKVSDFGWSSVQRVRMGDQMEHGTYGRQYRGQTPKQIMNQEPTDTGPSPSKIASGFAEAGLLGALESFHSPPKRVSQAVQSRLSPVLRQIGEAGDAATYSLANAGLQSLAGNKGAWPIYNGNYGSLGEMLDTVGKSFLANSPDEVAFWAKQPGLMERLQDADPKTPGGLLTKLALGMHADLARLKPGHPYLTGLETTGLEMLNPSWWVAGKYGGLTTRGALDELQAARLGKYGPKIQQHAVALAKFPIIGNRFTGMGDASGIAGEYWHSKLARNMSAVWPEAQDSFTGGDTFGGVPLEDQVNIVHLIEHPEAQIDRMGMPITRSEQLQKAAKRMHGGLSADDRGANATARVKKTENDLKTVAPQKAKELITGEYAPHDGAWQMQYDSGPNAGRGTGAGKPFMAGRVVPTIQDGLDRGLQLDPNWVPAASFVLHEGKMRQFITWMQGAKELEHLPLSDGKAMHSFDIDYKAPLDTQAFDEAVKNGGAYSGALHDLGRGAKGLEKLQEAAMKYANETAIAQAAQRGLDDTWIPKLAANARDAYIDRVRHLFTQQYPQHYFDAATLLGAPDLAGKAISRAGTEALIDVHPGLSRSWKSKAQDFDSWQRQNPGANPYGDDPHSDLPEANVSINTLEFLNHAVRFGRVLGLGYHGLFNLAPNTATRLSFKRWPWIARALGIDRTADIPSEWLDALDETGAVQKGVGGIGGIPTRMLAKLQTVPFKDLNRPAQESRWDELLGKAPSGERAQEPDYGARFLKGYTAASKWSQNIAFHYQERRLAAVLLHFLKEDEGLSTEKAAREVSKLLNDSHNLTPIERGPLHNWMYFYGWMRRGLRLSADTLVNSPQKIMAPLRGVQTANDLQGDEGALGGAALSLKAFGSAIEKMTGIKGLGTDDKGNPRYVDIPSFWTFGSTLARILGGVGHPLDRGSSVQAFTQRATSTLSPLGAIALGTVAGSMNPEGEMPGPGNEVMWDKDAPNKGAQWLSFALKTAAPVTLESPTAGLGPYMYSAPNSGKVSKAQYGALQDMRGVLVKANRAGDHDLAQQIYDQMDAINNGDAAALMQAKANVARWSAVLGVKAPFSRRSRYAPSRF